MLKKSQLRFRGQIEALIRREVNRSRRSTKDLLKRDLRKST